MGQARTAIETLELRPLTGEDAPDLRRIRSAPEVHRYWGDLERDFPWEEPEATRFTILLDGVVVGMIQFWKENERRFRHAGIDVFLDPACRGRGVGTEAVRRVLALLTGERGHHRVTIDPRVDNPAAIRSYTKVGFQPVGVLRRAELGPDERWHDVLLMEFVLPER